MRNAINYVIKRGGNPSQTVYPYTWGTGVVGTCAGLTSAAAKFRALYMSPTTYEPAVAAALPKYSPFFAAVDASFWQTYQSGAPCA